MRRGSWCLPLVITATLAVVALWLITLSFRRDLIVMGLIAAQGITWLISWRKWNRSEQELATVERELSSLQGIVDVSRDAIMGLTAGGIVMSWNKGARSMYGLSSKEALGAHISTLFEPERMYEAATLLEKVKSGDSVTQHETLHSRRGGKGIDVSLTICPIHEGTKIVGASLVARDITERKRVEESVAQQAAAMKASMDGIAIINHLGEFVYLNDAYAKVYGYKTAQSLIGVSWEELYVADELPRVKDDIMPAVWRDGSWRGEALGKKLNGSNFPVEISISAVAGGGLVQVVRDITERKDAEEYLRNISLKDELTGLHNRRGILKHAAPHFEFARHNEQALPLLFIDLDGMKQINDSFGHNEGNNALKNTAGILRTSFRESDIIARIGGDEFVVLVTDPNTNKEEAVARVKRNLEAFNGENSTNYSLSFSIGVAALDPRCMDGFEQLLEKADQAMYKQKRKKKRQRSDKALPEQPDSPASTLVPVQPVAKEPPSEGSVNYELLDETDSYATFDQAAIGMAVVSVDGSWLQVNDALCALLGYSERELKATNFRSLTHPDDLKQVESQVKRLLRGTIPRHQQEKRYIHKEGDVVWVLWSVSKLSEDEGGTTRLFFQVQDITDRKRAEEKLRQDTLTGLPNRAQFKEFLKARISGGQRRKDDQFAVLFLDVDRFTLVNDSLGHACGDQLLVQIAQRIKACMREGDVVARVGGDSFAVLLDHVVGEDEACQVAARIQQQLSISFNLFRQEVYAAMSIGISLSSRYHDDDADLLRDAETAMHRAKSHGKGRYEVFGGNMHGEVMSLLKMETDLRHATNRGELFVQYQPIVSLTDARLLGFEALARWQHPEYGVISPFNFIPVAEETGQILAIGQIVLRESCRQARNWQEQHPGREPLYVSVNLSVKQFTEPGLVDTISRYLREFDLDPRCLKLEITESVFTENVEAAVEVLKRLRELGVQLSIDDFGTGYSSLSYLHRFPINTLKIDRSFVAQMAENDENIEIVRTIVMLAQKLRMDVVAEGVETKDQLRLLQELGCEHAQGFFFSRPLAVSDVDNYIVTRGHILPPPASVDVLDLEPSLVG